MRFLATRDDNLCRELMGRYVPLLERRAIKLKSRLPECVLVEDLINDGVFGLKEAIMRYDPSRGVKFGTYAPQRIDGAMLDGLRHLDWAPRLVRSRETKLRGVRTQLHNELDREPTRDEVAARLGVTLDQLELIEKDGDQVRDVGSLTDRIGSSESARSATVGDTVPDRGADGIAQTEARDGFRRMLSGLTRAEQMLMMLYYAEEMTMKEIGAALDLSESRVSQMHSNVLLRLRARESDGVA